MTCQISRMSNWPSCKYSRCRRGLLHLQVEIVYHLFDLNDDGNLSATELVAVLEKREANTFMSANGDEKQTLFSCLYACAFDR